MENYYYYFISGVLQLQSWRLWVLDSFNFHTDLTQTFSPIKFRTKSMEKSWKERWHVFFIERHQKTGSEQRTNGHRQGSDPCRQYELCICYTPLMIFYRDDLLRVLTMLNVLVLSSGSPQLRTFLQDGLRITSAQREV